MYLQVYVHFLTAGGRLKSLKCSQVKGTHPALKWRQGGEDLARIVAVWTQLILFLRNCGMVLFRMTGLVEVTQEDSGKCRWTVILIFSPWFHWNLPAKVQHYSVRSSDVKCEPGWGGFQGSWDTAKCAVPSDAGLLSPFPWVYFRCLLKWPGLGFSLWKMNTGII